MRRKKFTSVLAVFLAAAMLCAMTGCKSDKETGDTEPTESQTSTVRKTSLTVESTTAKAGDKNVEVIVNLENNPGILGIDFDVYYDESVMELVDAQSMLELEGCVYTPPAYFRNPTTFLWDFQDANWVESGAFLKLYFNVSDTAPAGKYEIKIMYSYGNIFDGDFEPVDVAVKNGKISVS